MGLISRIIKNHCIHQQWLKSSIRMTFKQVVSTDASRTTILIRLMVGAVFLSEGIQKFLFPDKLGAGRFEKIGLPFPEFLGPFVGSFEIICGSLVLIGLLTRLASIPLIIIMLVAIATTKAEVLANDGFWEMMHGSRTDWAMLLSGIFLLIKGGGRWSVDQNLTE
jgi:putative oxidoreductase